MRIILLIVLLSFQLISFAQQKENVEPVDGKLSNYLSQSTYRIALLNAGIGLPPNFVNGRVNPGFEVGLQHSIKSNSNPKRIDYTILMGYFANRSLQRCFFIKPGIGYKYKPMKWLVLRPSLNNAIMSVWQTNDEFTYIGNGQFEKVRRQRLQLLPSIGLEAQFEVLKNKSLHYQALVGYDFGIQLPFSELSSTLPLNQVKVGFTISKNK